MGQRKLIGLGALGSAGSAFRGESKFLKFAVGGEEGTGSMETGRTTVQRSYRKSLMHPVDSPGLLFLKASVRAAITSAQSSQSTNWCDMVLRKYVGFLGTKETT